jgi:integrase
MVDFATLQGFESGEGGNQYTIFVCRYLRAFGSLLLGVWTKYTFHFMLFYVVFNHQMSYFRTKFGLNNMATIKFFIQKKVGTAGIWVRLRDGSIDAKANTKFLTEAGSWNNNKGQPDNLRQTEAKQLQNKLDNFKLKVLNEYNRCVGNEIIDSAWLKNVVTPKESADIPERLVAYFDFYAIQKRNVMKTASITKLNVNKHLLERMQKKYKRVYSIKDVNEDFKLSFYDYCVSEGYSINTIARALKFIKTICYHAESNDVEVSKKLSGLQIGTVKVDKIYLSKDEQALIEQCKEVVKPHHINARDWLIISCEVGQRVSDFLRFNKKMIRYEGGKPLIEFTQVKTAKIMTVPLSKKVMEILSKRDGEFPDKVSDQRYNEYIKDVCQLAKLETPTKGSIIDPKKNRKVAGIYPKWQLVTSHIGRRSFATNNYGIIPTSLLIGVTGHSTEKMFLEYIGKSDSQKAMQLAEYF